LLRKEFASQQRDSLALALKGKGKEGGTKGGREGNRDSSLAQEGNREKGREFASQQGDSLALKGKGKEGGTPKGRGMVEYLFKNRLYLYIKHILLLLIIFIS
jgi:hypothetical protein